MSLNRFAEAANDFTAVIRRNPRIAGYFDNRQNAYRGMGRLNEALNDANRAVRLAPTYAFVYGGRGTVFAEMGRYDLAIEDYTKAISLDSRNAGLFAGRGKISATAGQLNDAIADFTHALDMDRNMTVALRERGLAYQLLGNFDAARSDLSLFLRLQPNDREIVQALQDMPTLPEGRSGALPKTDEGSPPRVGSTPELESKMRIEKRDRLVSAAKQLIDEASAFIQADPRNPKTLDFADQIRLLNSATAESDPGRIEEQMRKLEAQIGTLSAALRKEPVFRKMETERNEARKRNNALYLVDAIKTAQSYKAFLFGYITQNATTQTAGDFSLLVKEIDAALNAPDLSRLSPLNEKVDLAIRQAGLQNDFLATPPAPGSSAKPNYPPSAVQRSTTDKNKFLVEGDLQDLVLLFNWSPSAPHVAKNLSGDIIFEGDKADVCLFQQDIDETLTNTIQMALGRYHLKTISIDLHGCPSDRLLTYDVVATKRGSFLRQEGQYAATLLKEIETDHLKRLLILTDAEIKSALAADAIKATEIEADIERGAKDGYGLVLLNTGSSAVCAVISEKVDGHRRLLLTLGDRLTSEMKLSPTIIVTSSLNSAFINIQRKQCGAVYASAQDLKELLAGLRNDSIDYRMSASWVTQPEIDAADKKIADEKAITAQQALERQRRAEEQRKLLAMRKADEAASKIKQQERLRSQFGKTANAAAASLSDEVKQFTESRGGNATAKYPGFVSWNQSQLADRWELISQNVEVFDYGVSDWKGRSLETAFAKVNIGLRNRMLGEYKDVCFIFGQIIDTEFDMKRDPVGISCDDPERLETWKSAHSFQSKWIVE